RRRTGAAGRWPDRGRARAAACRRTRRRVRAASVAEPHSIPRPRRYPSARGALRRRLLIIRAVPDRPPSDAEIEAAVEALTNPEHFSQAEQRVARLAPQLQRILNEALSAGGYFGEAHESQILRAATAPDPDERIRA